jgi:hypothetical protein
MERILIEVAIQLLTPMATKQLREKSELAYAMQLCTCVLGIDSLKNGHCIPFIALPSPARKARGCRRKEAHHE